ncbi:MULTISPECIES: amino acid ABC transporter permease [Cellulomonas]|uniref:amino acid ABC transporter permease n=1 Tax=Cellulomonas TaxID=1707 RepID=UPI0010A7F7BF|nr:MULTISPECIES: amino acid ABC transporter permease [Cellulomonas]
MPAFLAGFRLSLQLTLVAGAGALVVGALVAMLRVSPLGSLRAFGAVYTELLRNTPLTLVFFFTVYVLPQFTPFRFFGYAAAVLALTLYTSAFVAEAVRSGINSVGVGQAEAARAIGLTFGQTLTSVVLPQAVRSVIPPLINVIIALAKNTSVAAGFAVVELMATGRRLAQGNPGESIMVLVGVALFYLVITIPAGQLAGALERRVAFAR